MDPQRRKELKNAAKEAVPEMGVFQVRNTANGRILVGSSLNLAGSGNSFSYKLEFFSHHNDRLKADLESCGPDAFRFEILETIDPARVEKADRAAAVQELEKKWKQKLQPWGEKGYNSPDN